MPQKVLKFTGINRKVNEFQATGACEELINLRPEVGGGLSIVKPKVVMRPNVSYMNVYEHSWGDTMNLIYVDTDNSVSWFSSDNVIVPLSQGEGEVCLSSAGNVLVIYYKGSNTQYVYEYKDEDYIKIKSKPTKIELSVDMEYNVSNPAKVESQINIDSTESASSDLQAVASMFYGNNPNGLCGVCVIGCCCELEDGSELWSTGFSIIDATKIEGYIGPSYNANDKKVAITGANKVTVNLRRVSELIDIKKINVYASRPIFPYKANVQVSETYGNSCDINYQMPQNIGNQIMYYTGSVGHNGGTLYIDFSALAGDKIMNVDSGCIERIGPSVSYNNRFHFFKSQKHHVIQNPFVTESSLSTAETHICFVNFDGKWKMIDKEYSIALNRYNDFVYPLSGISEMAFVKTRLPKNGGTISRNTDMFRIQLMDSMAYNYSYSFQPVLSIDSVGDFYDTLDESGQIGLSKADETVFLAKESNSLNVSGQYNPLVFPVKYSYAFGGEVIDIATSYTPISATQVGQYPIVVFTTNGIYSMEQGDSGQLYQSTTPLQPLVLSGKAAPSPHGIFFISSNNVYLLTGRDVVNISDVVCGVREENIKNTRAFQQLCCNSSGGMQDFKLMLSVSDFEDYLDGATLTYDSFKDELYINDTTRYSYSFVFNVKTRLFHKVSRRYISYSSNTRYAIEELDIRTRNVVDMQKEREENYFLYRHPQPILLQSRPMSLEAFYTHIQRLILMVDAKLEGKNEYLFFSVFGSDNLYDWKCIISAQKQNCILRQIRTNRAAKSYKDYVILINGVVDTDTDLSDIIADYTVVSRRLG